MVSRLMFLDRRPRLLGFVLMLVASLAIYAMFIALAIMLFVHPAFAQSVAAAAAPDSTVMIHDVLAPWLQWVFAVGTGIISIAIAIVAAIVRAKTGIDIDQAHQNTLQTALTNAAGLLISRFGDKIGNISFSVGNPEVKTALMYLDQGAGDAIAHFGVTPDKLVTMLEAKIGQLLHITLPAPAAPTTATTAVVGGAASPAK